MLAMLLLTACSFASGDSTVPDGIQYASPPPVPGGPAATPAGPTPAPTTPAPPENPPRPGIEVIEVVGIDVFVCQPQSVSGQLGWHIVQLDVLGAEENNCVFEWSQANGGEVDSRYSCRVKRSAGRAIVWEERDTRPDAIGMPPGGRYSWDLGGDCVLIACSEDAVFPANCPFGR
jgi:hypothetical protein